METTDLQGLDYPIYFKSSCQWYRADGLDAELICITESVRPEVQVIPISISELLSSAYRTYPESLQICTAEEFNAKSAEVLQKLNEIIFTNK